MLDLRILRRRAEVLEGGRGVVKGG